MTGPQDRMAEQGRSPESPRPRESDRIDAQLRERLERLPPSHPSSPYNDDGSRKPPPPDLSAYELPIPGDPDYQEADSTPDDSPEGEGVADEQRTPDSEPVRSLAAGDKPHASPDGSWEWQGRSLSPEESRSADQALARWGSVEGRDADGNYGEQGLTPAMRRIEAELEHGELVPDTEKFALKGADRLKQKLAERISAQPGESADVLLSRIHDGIRYTFVYDDQDYTIGTEETEAALGESGYELITRKPSWDSPDYKGVNTQWRDSDSGVLFEVQFHTHASWDAKQKTHDAYERLSDPRALPGERARLDAYQQEVTASVPVPPGALEIPFYHKKGA